MMVLTIITISLVHNNRSYQCCYRHITNTDLLYPNGNYASQWLEIETSIPKIYKDLLMAL